MKYNYKQRARILAEREVGCPLTHCACGTHDVDNLKHNCEDVFNLDAEISAVERSAGWNFNT